MNWTGLVLTIVLLVITNVITGIAVQSHYASTPGTLTETSLYCTFISNLAVQKFQSNKLHSTGSQLDKDSLG